MQPQSMLPPCFSPYPVPAPVQRFPSALMSDVAGGDGAGFDYGSGLRGASGDYSSQIPCFQLGGLSLGKGGGGDGGDGGDGIGRFSASSLWRQSGEFGNGRLSGGMGSGMMRLSGNGGTGPSSSGDPIQLDDDAPQLRYYSRQPEDALSNLSAGKQLPRWSGNMSDTLAPASARSSLTGAGQPLYLGDMAGNGGVQVGALGARGSLGGGVSPLGFGFAAPVLAPGVPQDPLGGSILDSLTMDFDAQTPRSLQ
jgi:hypothetical protein